MYNKIELIGNLGKDPEIRYTSKNQAVANFPLATTQRWKDANGKAQERTEWHQVTVWGKLAELVTTHLTKGRQVFVEGRIENQKYKDKDGNDRYTTKVIAENVRFLGGSRQGTASVAEIEALTNKALAIVLDEDGDLTQAVTALKGILALCQKNAKQETQTAATEEVTMTEEQAELERKAQELGIFDSDSETVPY